MKTGWMLALAIMIAVAGAPSAFAQSTGENVPVVELIPDVVISDANAGDGQTGQQYYVNYNALDLDDYVTDEDDNVSWAGFQVVGLTGFETSEQDRNVSINGISQITNRTSSTVFLPWFNGTIADDYKNIIAGGTQLTVRGVTDLRSKTDLLAAGLNGLYAQGSGLSDDQALVHLMVADDEANTAVGQFLVKIGATSEVGQDVLLSTQTGYLPAMGFVGFGLNVPGAFNPPAIVDDTASDTVAIDAGAAAADGKVFGFWEVQPLYDLNWGASWDSINGGDYVTKVRWTLFSDVDDPDAFVNIPTVRSRIRTAFNAPEAINLLTSEMTVTTLGNEGLDQNLGQIFDGQEAKYVHYFYPGDFAEQMASTAGLQLDIDLMDLTADEIRRNRIDIDNIKIDLIDRASVTPADNEALSLKKRTGAAIYNEANPEDTWGTFSTTLDPFNGLGIVNTSIDGGLRIGIDADSYNLVGWWFNPLFYDALLTQDQLVRALFTVQNNSTLTTDGQATLRCRLYANNNEVTSLLEVTGRDGTYCYPPFAATPGGAGTPVTYEVYALTPQVYGDLAFGHHWGLALDMIDTGPAEGPGSVGATDVTLTEIEMQSIAIPY